LCGLSGATTALYEYAYRFSIFKTKKILVLETANVSLGAR